MKKHFLILIAIILCLCAVCTITIAAESEPTVATAIKGHNLSLDDNVRIVYLVNQTAPDGAETGVLCWTSQQENYTLENQQYQLTDDGTQIINGKQYTRYVFSELSAKMMTVDVYAVSYVKIGNNAIYSSLDKYSILQYCYNKKGSTTTLDGGTATLGELVNDLLNYGAMAQKYFGYRLDRLANAEYYEVILDEGTLEDGTNHGLYQCDHSSIVLDEAITPTCTQYGFTEGSHCATCGTILVAQQPIAPLGHQLVIDNPVEPTCSEAGRSYGMHCSVCNTVLVEPQSIAKKAHTKGNLIDICVESIENVTNPGLFECAVCHQQYYDSITQEDINIPILSITGDLTGISKTNKKNIVASYSDSNQTFELNAMLKLQGASSINYPKKNYNIQFFKDDSFTSKQKVLLVDSWGKQNKYTLKANWIDFSEMRNVISGKLYGDVVRSRNINDQFNELVNGGAIDGYPILLFQNGVYQGLYTLNTSKDDYLFNMNGDETTREAMLMVNDWGATGALREHIPEGFGPTWELEYASTEDNEEIGTDWVIESFNNVIDFINNNDGQDFVDGISQYINVPRAIDSMLYTWAMRAVDNSSKNILWVTYDGVQWTPSVYDMDGTWGMNWDGDMNKIPTSVWKSMSKNALWEKLYNNMYDEIAARWQELREEPLSIANIDKTVTDYYNLIPGKLYECEREKWPDVPSQHTNHATQIVNWAIEYFHNVDTFLGATIDETVAYKINIVVDDNTTVYAYLSNDYSKDPHQTLLAYSRNSDTGYLTTSDGQFNFKVVLAEGYEIDSITVTGTYKNLKTPADTGAENVYRITKISGDLIVTITTKEIEAPAENPTEDPGETPIESSIETGYTVTFVTDGFASVTVYPTQDMTTDGEENATVAYSLDGETGEPTKSGDGKVNFVVVLEEGYKIDSVTVEGNYKNLKEPDVTGVENGYRITKIAGDLSVTVTTIPE